MDRRHFLRSLVGGVAVTAGARSWPFRVFSFPTNVIRWGMKPGDPLIFPPGDLPDPLLPRIHALELEKVRDHIPAMIGGGREMLRILRKHHLEFQISMMLDGVALPDPLSFGPGSPND